MKTLAIAQARMGSTRVPGKVMRQLEGRPVLKWVYNALAATQADVVIATSTLPADNLIADYCDAHMIPCFRGSETDVLDRFYQCAKHYKANIILRLTCDCPFLDPAVISEVIKLREMTDVCYASNVDPPTYPDGLDCECFTFAALESAWQETTLSSDRDCVTQFITRNHHRFSSATLNCPLPGLAKERWVLDTEDDWNFCQEIAHRLPFGTPPSYLDILNVLDAEPQLRFINNKWKRNERFYEAIATESLPARSFDQSQKVFKRTIKTIPFGAQTFSKSHLQFPRGAAPLYCTHGDGGYLFDVDGNRYVDLVSAVLPVVLGYRDPDVDEAIRRQLDKGISFSLGTPLEAELSELLCHYIPCAEMTKFGKSGTDVTTAAVRLARAYTGREYIFLSGYHGWSDWSMACTDRNFGIPQDIRDLSIRLTYGDKDRIIRWQESLTKGFENIEPHYEEHYGIAAIVVEPNDDGEYLKWLREYCTKHRIVLIFDEIITGFRYGMGGAQELFGVTPDLATFGKAMANGMPISALVGRKDIMKLMEPPNNIFYSGTMFGETLSIAAAIATIKKLDGRGVISYLWGAGAELAGKIEKAIGQNELDRGISVTGYAPRKVLEFRDMPGASKDELRTLFMMQMIKQGVLIINSNNLTFAHKDPELKRIVTAYENTMLDICDAISTGNIHKMTADKINAAAPLRLTS